MAVTSNDIANQAIQLVGANQPAVVGQWPAFQTTGPAATTGAVLNRIYGPAVATVMRQFEWDFSRNTIALVKTANTPRLFAFEYAYPPNAIEVWALAPQTDVDPNDPLPINYVVANDIVSGSQARVIQTDQDNAYAIYSNMPNESTWDALFRESVVRLLASELGMAIAGKPDLSESLFSSYGAVEQVGESRQD